MSVSSLFPVTCDLTHGLSVTTGSPCALQMYELGYNFHGVQPCYNGDGCHSLAISEPLTAIILQNQYGSHFQGHKARSEVLHKKSIKFSLWKGFVWFVHNFVSVLN